MGRRKRTVIPRLPHHVTQRGVRRQRVFFRDEDRLRYLHLLSSSLNRYGCELIAFCLMDNHVHHLIVPSAIDSLSNAMQWTHKPYADYLNSCCGWTGHVWQERFYSSPVDEEFFWVALRYIERNPVRAKIVESAEQYRWSSAKIHCTGSSHPILSASSSWTKKICAINNYREWLSDEDTLREVNQLRKSTFQDLPTGSEQFLDELEQGYQVRVRPAKRGRPRKKGNR